MSFIKELKSKKLIEIETHLLLIEEKHSSKFLIIMNIDINYLVAIYGLIAAIFFGFFIGCSYCLFQKFCVNKSPNVVSREFSRRRSSGIVRETRLNMRPVIEPSAPPTQTQQIYSPFRIPRPKLPTYDQAIGKRY